MKTFFAVIGFCALAIGADAQVLQYDFEQPQAGSGDRVLTWDPITGGNLTAGPSTITTTNSQVGAGITGSQSARLDYTSTGSSSGTLVLAFDPQGLTNFSFTFQYNRSSANAPEFYTVAYSFDGVSYTTDGTLDLTASNTTATANYTFSAATNTAIANSGDTQIFFRLSVDTTLSPPPYNGSPNVRIDNFSLGAAATVPESSTYIAGLGMIGLAGYQVSRVRRRGNKLVEA
jgi:hypothetical protein